MKYNHEHYHDPTAEQALSNIHDAKRRVDRYIHFIKKHARQSGLEIEGRIVVIDEKTGMKFR